MVHQLGVDRHTVVVGELESLKFPAQTHFFKVGGGEVDFFLDRNADDGVTLQLSDHLIIYDSILRKDKFILIVEDIFAEDHTFFQRHASYIFHEISSYILCQKPFVRQK